MHCRSKVYISFINPPFEIDQQLVYNLTEISKSRTGTNTVLYTDFFIPPNKILHRYATQGFRRRLEIGSYIRHIPSC